MICLRKGSRKRPKRVKSLIGEIGNQRGIRNEQRFFRAIADFPDKPHWWLGVREKTPEEDQKGIDAVVTADVGKLFLQIKSSLRGKKKFEKKVRRSPIAVIVIQNQGTDEEICQKAIEAISLVRDQILKKRNQKRFPD